MLHALLGRDIDARAWPTRRRRGASASALRARWSPAIARRGRASTRRPKRWRLRIETHAPRQRCASAASTQDFLDSGDYAQIRHDRRTACRPDRHGRRDPRAARSRRPVASFAEAHGLAARPRSSAACPCSATRAWAR
ncbi:MAG: hypothetical protein MZW92_76570 [Comamonadaceae bacterium]|nr:hypothetical protein [Comamonadaceae bacterium]